MLTFIPSLCSIPYLTTLIIHKLICDWDVLKSAICGRDASFDIYGNNRIGENMGPLPDTEGVLEARTSGAVEGSIFLMRAGALTCTVLAKEEKCIRVCGASEHYRPLRMPLSSPKLSKRQSSCHRFLFYFSQRAGCRQALRNLREWALLSGWNPKCKHTPTQKRPTTK